MFDQSGDVQHGESPDSVGAQCASCAWIHSATSPISAGSTWPGCLYCASPDSPSTAMPRWLSVGYSLNSTCGSSWKPAFQRCQSASTTWMSCRSEEHTSELQSLMRNSYAVFCLKKKK